MSRISACVCVCVCIVCVWIWWRGLGLLSLTAVTLSGSWSKSRCFQQTHTHTPDENRAQTRQSPARYFGSEAATSPWASIDWQGNDFTRRRIIKVYSWGLELGIALWKKEACLIMCACYVCAGVCTPACACVSVQSFLTYCLYHLISSF